MHLFQGYGIELEYMIVDRDSLNVRPIADELLKEVAGSYVDEYVNGAVTWSNELVLHVIELKCSEPTSDLVQLEKDMWANIVQINKILRERFNAKLMPTATHPWMNPAKDTFLWPHGNSEVYEKYHQIFNCQGHGWSNLQSTHINLPFYDDEEFVALHTAVRLILPILPALAASSPIMDGDFTGYHDKRLIYYKNNQRKIESITGKIIPERITSKRQYQRQIYEKISSQIEPYDPDNILNPVWLNSRGVIARFDRGSLEIRILDIQECPKADLAIAVLVIHTLKLLVKEKLSSHHDQQSWDIDSLYQILLKNIRSSSETIIYDAGYLDAFGLKANSCSVKKLWKHLLALCVEYYPSEMKPWVQTLENILSKGSLAVRILEVADQQYTHNNLKLIYQEISENLKENQLFEPCDLSISL